MSEIEEVKLRIEALETLIGIHTRAPDYLGNSQHYATLWEIELLGLRERLKDLEAT
jgi:hypothetical protein